MAAKKVVRHVEAVPPRLLAGLRRLPAPVLRRLQSFVQALIDEKLERGRKKDVEGQVYFPNMLSGKVSMRLRYRQCGKDT